MNEARDEAQVPRVPSCSMMEVERRNRRDRVESVWYLFKSRVLICWETCSLASTVESCKLFLAIVHYLERWDMENSFVLDLFINRRNCLYFFAP